MHENVALLPMKDHSARVPNKNFRDFAGRPLYRWVLDTLLSIDWLELVVINTDSPRLLDNRELQDEARILLRRRDRELVGDEVSMNRIIADDIAAVNADRYFMTHSTNPLLSRHTLHAAAQKFAHETALGRADSLFTVRKLQTRFYRADGSPVNHDPDNLIPTQDIEPWFEENSNLYIFTRDSFAATGARIGQRPILFETPEVESIDIDTPEDWHIAEAIAGHVPYTDGATQ